MITIKKPADIETLIKGGKILADIMRQLGKQVKPGITTQELDEIAENLIVQAGGIPAFKGYGGADPFPATLCTSVNDEIVHGIPNDRPLKSGDILSIDIGMKWPADETGMITDHAYTFVVDKTSPEVKKLLHVTKTSLEKVIKKIKPGMHFGDIGRIIQEYVDSQGNYGIVRDLFGHGVGYQLHEDPIIAHFDTGHQGAEIKPGMVFAIEPMINLGSDKTKVGEDGWVIKTVDGKVSAHFEHTVVATDKKLKIITQ